MSIFLRRNFVFIPLILSCLAIFSLISALFVDPVFAQAAAPATAVPQPSFGEVLSRMLPMFVLVFMIYYFMIVKPQQLKLKSQSELTSSLKKGDTVVTSSGIFAKVAGVESDAVLLEIAPNVKVKVELSHIARKHDVDANAASATTNSTPVSRVK